MQRSIILKLFKTFINYSGISIVIFLMFFTGSSFAENYEIKKGDNLYSLSKKYGISVDEIKKTNNLQNNKLKIGAVLDLPSKKSTAAAKKTSSKTAVKPSDNDGDKTYIVRKGDTLIEIAQDYNITVKEIKQLNKLKKTAIKAGQKLLLPVEKDDNPTEISAAKEIEINSDQSTEIDNAYGMIDTVIGNNDVDLEFLDRKERLILFAKKFLDIPYRFGGTSMLGIDCSAFVQKVFDFFNVPLPRTAREQFYIGSRVDKDDLTVGDVVFFRTYAKFPSHVGIYMGDNLFIHASSKDKKVKINSLDEPYYFKRFLGAKRLIEPQAIESNPEAEEDNSR